MRMSACSHAALPLPQIKPDNILLFPAARPGDPSVAKLGDFGAALAEGSPGATYLHTSQAMGSCHYAAPEVIALHKAQRAAKESLQLHMAAPAKVGSSDHKLTKDSPPSLLECRLLPTAWSGSASDPHSSTSSTPTVESVHWTHTQTSGKAPHAQPSMTPQVAHGMVNAFAADVWSLGVTVFVVVTGRWPFGSADPTKESAVAYRAYLAATGQGKGTEGWV